tara:strand:- start:63283 stop:64524 length:1242 start_codon:yes stop_codon:yes gene_type:complete
MAAIRLKQLALACVALVTFCAVALTGISNYYAESKPQQALSLNPLNAEAANRFLANWLIEPDSDVDFEHVDRVARMTIRYAPSHAQTYGLLGEIRRAREETKNAYALYDAALSVSSTEAIALQRTLATAIIGGDYAEAMAKLDILFRRWPSNFSTFAVIIQPLLRDPEGYKEALATLRTGPPWRRPFLGVLNRDVSSLDLAYRLQLDLNSDTDVSRQNEIGETLSALLRSKKYDQAYRLFLLTLNEEDQRYNGYVFNGNFILKPSGRPFDWAYANRPGVRISRIVGNNADGTAGNLTLGFLGKPVKNISLSQYIYLPAGKYRLSAETSAYNLKAPRGLYWKLDCINPVETIARIDIPEGSYRNRMLQTEFDLPDSSCRMTRLQMGTDLIAESFRYPYSGTMRIHEVALRNIGL